MNDQPETGNIHALNGIETHDSSIVIKWPPKYALEHRSLIESTGTLTYLLTYSMEQSPS